MSPEECGSAISSLHIGGAYSPQFRPGPERPSSRQRLHSTQFGGGSIDPIGPWLLNPLELVSRNPLFDNRFGGLDRQEVPQ
jgi:hypothetical protein